MIISSISTKKTYKDYKEFFEEVNQRWKKDKDYLGTYVLLFSFLEDRINRIYKEQYLHKHKVSPNDRMCGRVTLVGKCDEINNMGLKIGQGARDSLYQINDRRNKIIHSALFKYKSITESDVVSLDKMSRFFNRRRESQKRILPKKKSRPIVLSNYNFKKYTLNK